MFKKTLLLLCIYFFIGVNLSFALDWKKTHEKADNINLSDALADANAFPDSKENLYVLGLILLNLHKDSQAAEAFDKILSLDPNVIEAKWGKAEVLRRRHRLKESENLLKEVLRAGPDFPAVYISLAYIKYTKLNFNEAVRLAAKVLALPEKNVDRSNRTRAYLICAGAKGMIAHYGGPISKLINGTSVLPNLRLAEKLQPDSAGVKFGLGSFYLLASSLAGGNLEKAGVYLKQAIEIDPLFVDAYVRLAEFYKVKADITKYNEYLNKALKIDAQNELAIDLKSGRCKFICPD